ncbi:hypothetical protein ERS043839_02273, partial [Streptococcus pneumoniae]
MRFLFSRGFFLRFFCLRFLLAWFFRLIGISLTIFVSLN